MLTALFLFILTVYLMFIKLYYNSSNVPHISELFTDIFFKYLELFYTIFWIMFLNSFCANPIISAVVLDTLTQKQCRPTLRKHKPDFLMAKPGTQML